MNIDIILKNINFIFKYIQIINYIINTDFIY